MITSNPHNDNGLCYPNPPYVPHVLKNQLTCGIHAKYILYTLADIC